MDLQAEAKALAARVEDEVAKDKLPVAVRVIDIHENPVLQHRMDEAAFFSIKTSERKACTAALVGMRTAALLPFAQSGQSLQALPTVAGGTLCQMGGGVPLSEYGDAFARVGVSGGTVDEDIAIAGAHLR